MTIVLTELLDELRESFGTSIEPEDGPSAARSRQIAALNTIADFLESAGLERSYCNEIVQLSNALHDLDAGKVAPLLKPIPVKTRAPDTNDIWLGRAHVAIVFELLRRTAHSREDTKAFITSRETKLRHLMSGKAKNAGTSAASWHWHLKNAPAGSSIASQVFSNGVKTIDALVKQGLNAQAAESAAKRMLKKSGLISLSVTLDY